MMSSVIQWNLWRSTTLGKVFKILLNYQRLLKIKKRGEQLPRFLTHSACFILEEGKAGFLEQWFPSFNVHQITERLGKMQMLGPAPRVLAQEVWGGVEESAFLVSSLVLLCPLSWEHTVNIVD